ncbi:MAG: carboxy terminal-processing peptidase, partial [Bacteroidales bacterium]
WYEYDTEKREFAKNKKELKERWRTSLKYETMNRIYQLAEEQEKAAEKSDTVTIKSFTELELEGREKILKRYQDWFHRMGKLDEEDRLATYVNALVNVYDPHSEYFPPRDKENFDIRFSGQLEGIGAQLTQKNEYVEVSRIIPGSPSWKQGDLEVGDYIIKVAQDGEDAVDIVDMRLDDAVQLIRGKKGTKVNLTVKKVDGTIETISIVRDVVILEETYAKSAVIKDEESGLLYGYLRLPSFYVDFSKANGRNCFDDVKKEIEKLNNENIEGLVFDLRDNGGGSLEDVVKIAGLFIEEGPVVQSMGKKGAAKVLRDQDPKIQYDGPMVVMVNAISASASEIFAAAMQDYNRAIVVGGNSTYGKGTVQNFTELDRMVPKKPADMTELGSLKMTIQKFYRVNGGSTQMKGVVPVIIFPDYYNYMDFGEKDMEYAMAWSQIEPVSWSMWTPAYDVDYLINISKKRTQSDTLMMLVEENGQRMEEIREDTRYSLNYNEFKTLLDEREAEGKRFDRIGKDTLDLVIGVLQADKFEIEADTSKKARTDAWITGLKKDIYLMETWNILKDINAYETKNARKEEE